LNDRHQVKLHLYVTQFLIYFWGSDITLELNIAEKIKLTHPVTANEISTRGNL